MEILLFTLGNGEIFGINVFKVREVSHTPTITKTPNMPLGVEGFISLRGNIIPVIALATSAGLAGIPEVTGKTMIVTQFSGHVQGLLVHDVDRIVRVDWEQITPPREMHAQGETMITAITRLPDGRLVSILDMEQILTDVIGIPIFKEISQTGKSSARMVFFADDSLVARKAIIMVLDKLGEKYQQATDGQDAWGKLQGLASRAGGDNPMSDQISVILVDVEMPRMDGYELTKKIKGDARFKGIPVIMHSSLSADVNMAMGKTAGVDAYLAKFDPVVLANTLRPFFA
ncbi:MAG: chemotaxis protein CheV [Sulfuricella sp.]|nr:chemotaxis protein CheV [Sulfuricella sp.]